MKKLLTLLFCVQLAFSAIAAPWDGTTAASFAGGTGTAGDPYQIATAEQLSYLASLTTANANTAGKYYKLTADIDLNGPTRSWIPIGLTTTTAFAGVFDGNYHTISNIYINDATTVFAGLFGYPTGTAGTNVIIKNLTIASGSITVTNSSSTAGAFAGRAAYTQFINCKNAINVKGISQVGGIVGILGTGTCIVEYCSNTGAITCAGAGLYLGGITGSAGTTGSSFIRYCFNTGAVTAISHAGGIVGTSSGSLTIKECFNTATISATNTDAGGIVGYGYGASFDVLNCYNRGLVRQTSSGATTSINGGILGYPGGNALLKYFHAITNCYNTGAVTAAMAGGTVEAIAGALKGGPLTTDGTGSVANSYYLSTLSVTNANGGTAKTDAELKAGAFLTLINVSSVWGQNASYNSGYPYLLWQVLSTPTVNTASSIIQYGFTANWNAVSNAISYDVKVYDGSSALISTTNVAAGTLSKAITGLIPSTSYTYTVTAKGDNSTYLDSNASTPSSSFSTSATTPWDGTTASTFAGGSGTSGDPYQIATAEQLSYLASLANATQTSNANTAGKYYKLTADIDLNGSAHAWTPIGIATATAFAGVFDGNNKSIYNIYINDATTLFAGLFGYPTGTSGTNVIIKNLTIASGSITVTNSGSTAGAFAGRSVYTQFINCKNIINVSGYSGVGGIVGTFGNSITTGIIEYCSNAGTISGSGASLYVGGIVGNSSVNTSVSPISYIRYCYNTGAVNAVSSAGGIAGTNSGTLTIQECFNKGTITASTSNSGGIVGYGYGLLNVLNCNNTGAVRSTHATSVAINGGILGNPGTSGAGKYFTAITNCYNTGAVTAVAAGSTLEAIAGLLAGTGASGTGSVVNSFYLNTLTGITNANGGTGVDASTLQGYASTLDATKWSSDVSPNKNNGYPILTWQTATSSSLTAPTVGTASSPITSGFTANWTAVSNALGYTVSVYQGTTFVQSKSVTGQATATLAITGLTANTSYTYKVAAISNTGTVDSNESSASATVTTLGVPTVTNQAVTVIASTTATANGDITSLGNPNPTQYGHCWNTSTTPTTSNSKTTKGAASATGTYTSSMTGLISSTTYYVRAYATNTAGTVYGNEVSFSTTTAATDYFRSKATGNWSDAATWESSNNNSTWVSATVAPTSSATGISILTGHTVTIAANATTSSLTINSGGTITVNAGIQFTVSTTLSNSGTLNLVSSASGTATILTPETLGGTGGSYSVQQYLSKSRNWYMTSPVSGATASVVNPQGSSNLLYWYDETKGSPAGWTSVTSNSTSLTPGLGYIVKPAADGVTLNFNGGSLNTGATPSLTVYRTSAPDHAGFNLIGNPFPSYLNARTVINSSPNLDKSIWYRTQITNSTTYKFDTYNTTSGQYINASGNNTYIVGTVPPMQAFWVRVSSGQSSASVNFSNSYRTHATADTLNPLKVKSQLSSAQPALRLQVSNGVNSDETLIYSDPNALNGYDMFDSQKMSNANASIPELYTLAGTEQLAINGMNSIPYDTEIVLGFSTLTSGSFSIKASQFSNFTSGTQIILKDNVLNAEQDLTLADYSFTSAASNNSTNRFTLIFHAPSVATGINPESNDNVWISTHNGQLVINGTSAKVSVEVFNTIGQKVISGNITSTNAQLNNNLSPGAYLVKLTIEGKSITKKMIID